LRTVAGVRVQVDVGQSVDPPALVIVPPHLTYDSYNPGPTEATFRVPLVVASDDRSIDTLEALLPLVEQAVHDSADASLTEAVPGSWGSPSLPCFLLTIEVSV
jgi:hypothetical protein